MTGIRPAAAAGTRGPCALADRKYNRGLGQLAWHEQSTAAVATAVVATAVVATAVVATAVGAGKATAVALILVAVAAAVRVGRPQQGLVALA